MVCIWQLSLLWSDLWRGSRCWQLWTLWALFSAQYSTMSTWSGVSVMLRRRLLHPYLFSVLVRLIFGNLMEGLMSHLQVTLQVSASDRKVIRQSLLLLPHAHHLTFQQTLMVESFKFLSTRLRPSLVDIGRLWGGGVIIRQASHTLCLQPTQTNKPPATSPQNWHHQDPPRSSS